MARICSPEKGNKMDEKSASHLHDAYAADYDYQVISYGCHLAEVLFGLCYEYTQPDQRLLDAGIGSGLSAILFAKAGLIVDGFDFSPAMLEVCRRKNIARELKQHDLQQIPWPYPEMHYDILVCCGVMHFISDLEGIFGEARRALRPGGWFAFTTKNPPSGQDPGEPFEKQVIEGFDIFSHPSKTLQSLLELNSFKQQKIQQCIGGGEIFNLWIVKKE
jgi:predicted TPR repeat methyltransferase